MRDPNTFTFFYVLILLVILIVFLLVSRKKSTPKTDISEFSEIKDSLKYISSEIREIRERLMAIETSLIFMNIPQEEEKPCSARSEAAKKMWRARKSKTLEKRG